MTAGTIAVLVGIVWSAVIVVLAWRMGRRLRAEGRRYPVAESGIEVTPARPCGGCVECTPEVAR